MNAVEKNFVLCVDLDGVVADYESAFKAFVAAEHGLDPARLEPQPRWEFDGLWGIRDRDHYLELHAKAVTEGRMFATMPAIAGASDALWRLSDADVHLRIVTHRLVVKGSHNNAVADTVAWLQQPRADGRPLVPYKDICFIAQKADVGGDMYVDDAPHNVEALRSAGYDVIVMDALYNQHVEGPRARSWAEIEHYVAAKRAWQASDPMGRR